MGLVNHLQSKNVFFGRIRAVVPNLSSAGFGQPSQIWVRPDSDGQAGSAGFGLTGGFCRIRAFLEYVLESINMNFTRNKVKKNKQPCTVECKKIAKPLSGRICVPGQPFDRSGQVWIGLGSDFFDTFDSSGSKALHLANRRLTSAWCDEDMANTY